MTERELASEISDRLKISLAKAEKVVILMKHAVATSKVATDLTTSGRRVLVSFVPGLPEER